MRKGFPCVAEQTHEVFYPTTSSSKRISKKVILGRDLGGGSSC